MLFGQRDLDAYNFGMLAQANRVLKKLGACVRRKPARRRELPRVVLRFVQRAVSGHFACYR